MRIIKKLQNLLRLKQNFYWWNNISIRTKLFISLGLSTVLFVLTTGLIFILLQNIKSDLYIVKEKGEKAENIAEIGSLIRAKDIRIADYITFLNVDDVKKYRELRNELNNRLIDLEENITNEEYQKMITKINQNNLEIDNLFNKQVIPSVVRLDVEIYTQARKEISSLREENGNILEKLNKKIVNERNKTISSAESSMKSFIMEILILAIVVTILSGIIVFLLSQSIKNNLNKIIGTAKKVSNGELNVEMLVYSGKDEIGEIINAVNGMTSNLRTMVNGIKGVSETIYLNSGNLRDSSSNVKKASEAIFETMEILSAGAEEQAAASDQLFSHYDALNNEINLSTNKGMNLKQSAENVLQTTDHGQSLMFDSISQISTVYQIIENTVNEIGTMEKKMGEINGVAEVIKAISAQTRLLALNASIEAARAGELGKGFAVVAQEVKKLASEVELSLVDINDLVRSVQEMFKSLTHPLQEGFEELKSGTFKLKNTEEGFDSIKKEMGNMVGNVLNISKHLEVISHNSLEVKGSFESIASTSQQFNSGTIQTSYSIKKQDQELEFILLKANEMAEQANVLSKLVEKFKL